VKRPLTGKPIGKFTRELRAVADPRLRFALLGSLLMSVFFAIHFIRIFMPGELAVGDGQQDYAAFFGAAKFALTGGGANLYDPAVFQVAIGADTTLLWLYPPPMLFLLAPLGLLPYGAAKLVMVLATILCAVAIGRFCANANLWGAVAAISPAAFATLFVGQVSAFFALLLVAGLTLAERRPVFAGACFALLTIKPQYGLLVIPFLIATKAWRAIAAACGFSLLLVAASSLLFGVDMWRDFFESLTAGVHASYYQSGGHPGRITLTDAIKAIGAAPPPALIAYAPLIAIAAAGVFLAAKPAPRPLLIAYTLAASALVCPYLFVYDFFLYNAAILIVATARQSFKPYETYLLAALWFAPIAPFIGGSTLTPALIWPLTALGVALIYVIARRPAPAT